MAQRVQVFLIDDLDGSEAEETVEFGVHGSIYEIDLSRANATKLREIIAPFVQAGRKVSAKHTRVGKRGARSISTRERSGEIRAWAKAAGKPVNERGRIPKAIVDEYEAAQRA